jgi:hypothetical protein
MKVFNTLEIQYIFHSEREDNERRTGNRSLILGFAPDGKDEMLRAHRREVYCGIITLTSVRAGQDDGLTGEVDRWEGRELRLSERWGPSGRVGVEYRVETN